MDFTLTDEQRAFTAAFGRFIDEATAANRIRHENIINILDLSKLADGRPDLRSRHRRGHRTPRRRPDGESEMAQ